MSSDEDFSLVMEDTQTTMEATLKEIQKYKAHHARLLQEQQELSKLRDEQLDLAQQFRQRSDRLRTSLQEDETNNTKEVVYENEKLSCLREDESKLKREIERAEGELLQLKKNNSNLEQQTNVFTAVPEKRVIFAGETGDGESTQSFDMTPRIVFPMEGGTALITFEEEDVAKNILDQRVHTVDLGSEVTITLEAKPIQLLMPGHVEMDTQICPRRILVSNLPKSLSEEKLLDKLELHFGRPKNGGGEVDGKDLLDDSGNVVLTFAQSNVAKPLTEAQTHEVDFGKSVGKNKVKVTPFLNGEITKFEPRLSECSRTVLLTGIPAVMEEESLQDLLEIHFQKSGNGGGEVDSILYNPLGQRALALFLEDCPPPAEG